MNRSTKKTITALAVSVLVACADAALVSYDVGDYVQDGLVSQFDGIRNVGANLPHDVTAGIWKNLAGGPDFVISNESQYATSELWMDDGFLFMTNVWAKFDGGQDVTTNFSVQMVCDVSVDVASHGNTVPKSGSALYPALLTTWDTIHTCTFFTRFASEGSARLEVRNDRVTSSASSGMDHSSFGDWNGRNFTMVMDDDATYLFSGDARSNESGKTIRSRWRMEENRTWAIGRTIEPGDRDGLRGIVHAIRFYDRALTDDEVAHNNIIDRFRFRGERSATNVVVTSSRPGLCGAESGNCQVDGSHVFTASAVCTNAVGTAVYACVGYTLETWDGGTWSVPVTNVGALAYAYDVSTSPAKVRLTWLWSQTDGIVLPEPCDYVQDGLVLQYDAICNDGAGRPRRDRPLIANLVDPSNPLYMIDVGEATGRWGNNAYCLRGRTFGEMSHALSALVLGGSATVEMAVDVDLAKQTSTYHYLFGTLDDKFSCFKSAGYMRLKAPIISSKQPLMTAASWNGRYMAAAAENHTAYLTDGIAWPSNDAGTGERDTVGPLRLLVSGGDKIDVSAYPEKVALVGDFHSLRIYGKRLSEAELAYNRAIDEWRFHNAPPVTNVIVTSLSPAEASHAADGVYQVMGTHVFRAPCARAEKDGRVYLIDGFRIDRYDAANGDWTSVGRYYGDAYEYAESDGMVRLTWLWKRGGGIVTYDVDDYIQADLAVNFDAFRNAGAGLPHDNNAAVWTDTAGSGLTIGFSTQDATKSGWSDDRYRFARVAMGAFSGPLLLPESSSIQMVLADMDFDTDASYPNFFCRPDDIISIFTRGSGRTLEWKHHGSQSLRKKLENWEGRYIDAIMNENSFFLSQDTTRGTAQAKTFQSYFKNYSHTFNIGAEANDLARTHADCSYHAVRIYYHSLLDWELAWNRVVDEARYRGAPPVTNVVVAVENPSLGFEGAEPPGVYQVGEAHEFSAERQKVGNYTYRVGYTLETWDVARGDWTSPVFVPASRYLWRAGESPDKVRITWSWKCNGCMLIFK